MFNRLCDEPHGPWFQYVCKRVSHACYVRGPRTSSCVRLSVFLQLSVSCSLCAVFVWFVASVGVLLHSQVNRVLGTVVPRNWHNQPWQCAVQRSDQISCRTHGHHRSYGLLVYSISLVEMV